MLRNLILPVILALTSLVNAQTLDPSFGVNGTKQLDIGGSERLFGVTMQPDGRIVACGLRDSIGIGHVLVARFLDDGSFDPGFGTNGWVMVPTGTGGSDASRVLVQPDGRILVAGKAESGGALNMMLRRFLPNGAVDNSFGNAGVWMAPILPGGSYGTRMALDPTGKIIVAGTVISANFLAAFAVVRLNENGTLDPTFGTGGSFIKDESDQVLMNELTDMAILPDGRIVLVGNKGDLSTGPDWNTDLLYQRLLPNGQLDTDLALDGELTIDPQGMNDGANRLKVHEDGVVELIGTSTINGNVSIVNRTLVSEIGEVLSTELIPVDAWAPSQTTKEISAIEPGPDGRLAYIGTVPNGGTADGFLGFIGPSAFQGQPYQAGYNTTVDPGDWTVFAGGSYDNNGRLILVGLTTNPDWIGQFPNSCGVFTDLFLSRFQMPLVTGIHETATVGAEVWPVPARDHLQVRTSGLVERIQLIDLAGRTVLTQRGSGAELNTLDVTGLEDGTYILKMDRGDHHWIKKVIIQK